MLQKLLDRLKEIRKELRSHTGDLLTPVTIKTSVKDDKVNYLYEHQAESLCLAAAGKDRNSAGAILGCHVRLGDKRCPGDLGGDSKIVS